MDDIFSLPDWHQIPDIELYMDQVLVLLNKYTEPFLAQNGEEAITSSMLNNYVKQKLLPPPNKKKYNREHVSRFCIICILKRVLSITQIKSLLDALEKKMSPEQIYTYFSHLLTEKSPVSDEASELEKALSYAVLAFRSAVSAEKYLQISENQ